MNRRFALAVISLAAAGTAFSACSSTTEVISGQQPTGISVQGVGEVSAPTDTGVVTLGVQVVADTVAEARDRAAEGADAILRSARNNGVDDDDLRTVQLTVAPRYEYRNEEMVLVGFEVTNLVEVTVRNLDAFSEILDDAIDAGGDDVRVSGIQFTIEDTASLLEEARKLAMEDAKEKAEQLAGLGDVGLGRPITISESQSANLPPKFVDDLAGADVATPVQPGTGTITVSVSVLYAIED